MSRLAEPPLSVKTGADLLRVSLPTLERHLGGGGGSLTAQKLYAAVRGREHPRPRELVYHRERKSIGAEISWGMSTRLRLVM